MSTRVTMDESLQRVFVTVLPEPSSDSVAETVLRLTSQRRELGGWDWIIDIRNPHDKATPEQLDLIAAAFNAARSRQNYTIFISEDPATYDRCALMELKFLNRRHLVAKTPTQALALLPWNMPTI